MSLWRQFQQLLPKAPLTVAKVLTHNADGSSSVEFPGGGTFKARGQGVDVGGYAFVRGGEVLGPAPAVVPVTLEV